MGECGLPCFMSKDIRIDIGNLVCKKVVSFSAKKGYNIKIIHNLFINGGFRMKGHLDSQLGNILIDPEVIAKYAGSTAVECFGIVGMAAVSMKDGLVKLLKGDSLTRGISVVINEENKLEIDFHVIVSYGVSISTVADNLIENVKYKVQEFTGLEIKKINIFVEGVRVID